MTMIIKCNTVNLLKFQESFHVAYLNVIYIYLEFIDGKKLSTDNGNILDLNLQNSAVLFKTVHFDCEDFFFFFFFF